MKIQRSTQATLRENRTSPSEDRSLKSIVKILREAKEEQKEIGEDSLDDQIDRYFVSYEAESKKSKNEGLDFRMMTRVFLLEAEKEEKDEKNDKENKGSEEAEKSKAIAAPKSSLEDLDMSSFVSDVIRLVDNYDSLLEVRNTILRRAANFLSKNYEKVASDAFKEELLESYGIEIGQSESEKTDEFMAPKAGAAGPAGGGA